MLKLLAKFEADGSVELFQTQHGYAIRYGLEVKKFDTLPEAMSNLWSAAWHSAECAGLIENES